MIYIILFSCSYLESKEDARTIVKRWLNQEITFPDSINTTSQDSLWQFMLKKEFKILTVIDTNICTECRLKLYDYTNKMNTLNKFPKNPQYQTNIFVR